MQFSEKKVGLGQDRAKEDVAYDSTELVLLERLFSQSAASPRQDNEIRRKWK